MDQLRRLTFPRVGGIKVYIENNPVKAGLVANAGKLSLVERGEKSRDESNLISAQQT